MNVKVLSILEEIINKILSSKKDLRVTKKWVIPFKRMSYRKVTNIIIDFIINLLMFINVVLIFVLCINTYIIASYVYNIAQQSNFYTSNLTIDQPFVVKHFIQE